jgi:NitT/TauT family transport system substrate-binding protein
VALAALPLAALAACGGSSGASTAAADPSATAPELRLGYFANVTHAAALIGVQQKLFQQELGATELSTQVFNAGPAEVEALFAGGLDAAYIGPSPTITAYGQSNGDAVRIVAGAASGGAELVVGDGITSAADLKGKQVASPQLGNTQDVALRTWLKSKGLSSSVGGGGDVTVSPTSNSDVPALFDSGQLAGAWAPEPYASSLVLGHGGHVLVDEKSLWPDGRFVTTQLVVRTEFLQKYPGSVAALLRGHVKAVQLAQGDPATAKQAVDAGLQAAGGKSLPAAVLDRAWGELTVTWDPLAGTLARENDNGVTAGTQPTKVDLTGIYDLQPLNAILSAAKLTTVSAAGLGQQ